MAGQQPESVSAGTLVELTKKVPSWLVTIALIGVLIASVTFILVLLHAYSSNRLQKAWGIEFIPTDNDIVAQQQAAMPEGAVMAFDLPDGCPAGWDEFGDAAGRTIIGAGSGMMDQNNQPLSGRKYREHGGEEQQTLTKEEMPDHRHVVPHKGADFGIQAFSQGTSLGVTRTIGEEDTTNEGGGRPHNNMPPYIALYFCKYEGTG